ncbi:MAG TPA: TolC family protein [Candidatus Aminicenantes bacterium]|nr:TolC family protein [Candidatus Aminicenantes bacterium]
MTTLGKNPPLRIALWSLAAALATACAPTLPRARSVPLPLAPAVSQASGAPASATGLDAPPADAPLSMAQAAEIALARNPATRAAWADARAAAARYGSARGAWLPTVDLEVALTRGRGLTSSGKAAGQTAGSTVATASISYLLLDCGGRSGAVAESRLALLAADWTRNAVVSQVLLQAELAYLDYAGALSLLDASRTSLSEAEANLGAAEERQRLGLATRADVLLARTALAEATLSRQSAEGQVRTRRGALATVLGLPANAPFTPQVTVPEIPKGSLDRTVDQLVEQALTSRPELQATLATADQARARVRQARSALLPTLSLDGWLSRNWIRHVPGAATTYSGALTLAFPLFDGFSGRYDLRQAQATAEAATERARATRLTVIEQVVAAHSDFLTAGQRVQTTTELLASATQSAEMALGRYQEGVGGMLDLLSAQRTLAQARAEQVDARLSWFASLAQLAHDVGVLGPAGDNPLTPSGTPSEVTP